jgi:histidinol-phosphate/aromatic aminotransferase/cobyric acid decarboxylase-like protein
MGPLLNIAAEAALQRALGVWRTPAPAAVLAMRILRDRRGYQPSERLVRDLEQRAAQLITERYGR